MKLLRIIDLECTGLDPAMDRICEVATIDVRFEESPLKFERGEIWETLCDPQKPISPEASGIHDIVDEMVSGKPPFSAHLERLKAGPPDAYCAHNSKYDTQFFRPANIPWICTYKLALWCWPEAPSHKLAALRYWLKLKLAPPAGMVQRAHNALWDAYVCAAVLRRVAMAGVSFEDMLAVSSQPALLPRLTFGEHAMKPIAEVDSGYLQWILNKGGGSKGFDEDVLHTAMTELQRRRDTGSAA
jgi:DNA polymerase III epsilon subunit-like protein